MQGLKIDLALLLYGDEARKRLTNAPEDSYASGDSALNRLEVVETGRRRRWSKRSRLGLFWKHVRATPGCGDSAAIWRQLRISGALCVAA